MFDMSRYFETAFPTQDTQWTTKNDVVYEDPAIRVRLFGIGLQGETTLILPPQAGHDSTIADYGRGRSIVETTLKTRGGPVYLIEWLPCTQERKNEGVLDLLLQVRNAMMMIQDKMHLIGLCQGGWLAAIITSMYQEEVLSLTCIASPIDFHAGGGAIYDTITKNGMEPYKMGLK